MLGDYQSGQTTLPGVWVEKSGLGWKKRSLPGICSASLVTWTMCWQLQGCKHRNHFYLSCYLLHSGHNHFLFSIKTWKSRKYHITVKCDTNKTHTNWVEMCLHKSFLCLTNMWLSDKDTLVKFGQLWGWTASDRIYRQFAVRKKEPFMDLWVMLKRKTIHWSVLFAYSYTHGCVMYCKPSCENRGDGKSTLVFFCFFLPKCLFTWSQ